MTDQQIAMVERAVNALKPDQVLVLDGYKEDTKTPILTVIQKKSDGTIDYVSLNSSNAMKLRTCINHFLDPTSDTHTDHLKN